MTEYFGQVIDGAIKKLNLRRGVCGGKLSPDSTYIANGFLPIVGQAPAYDSATQRLQGPQYVVNGEQIDKVYTVVDISEEDLQAKYLKSCEDAVDAHILAKVKSIGYDNEDSIAKYLRPDSPWYAECVAIGAWIDSCWAKCHELLNAGVEIPVDELIKQMPEFTYGL